MANLAKALTELDVPADIIADIDIIRNENDMRAIVEALAGDWMAIRPLAQSVRPAIDSNRPTLSLNEIKEHVRQALDEEPRGNDPKRELRSKIGTVFSEASPWEAVKQAGVSAIPQGQATQDFRRLQELCEAAGLWIVPVGELEGFCRSIGGDGSRWVRQVIAERQLATDADLGDAREFVGRLWASRR